MTKISSPFRMKVLRKIGVSLWPWCHMTLKQVEKLDKIVQKQSKQKPRVYLWGQLCFFN